MTTPVCPSYAGYRFPAEIISHAVWPYFRFPLSLRHVHELLAARGIVVSHETVRQWGFKFGQGFANQIRRRLPSAGDKWHGLISCVARVSCLTYIKETRSGLWPTREEIGYCLCQTRHDAKFIDCAIRAHWALRTVPITFGT